MTPRWVKFIKDAEIEHARIDDELNELRKKNRAGELSRYYSTELVHDLLAQAQYNAKQLCNRLKRKDLR